MKIYLDEPVKNDTGEVIKIEGIPLAYTPEGSRYLLAHYEALAKTAKVGPQYSQEAYNHLFWVINRIKKCIEYYEISLPERT